MLRRGQLVEVEFLDHCENASTPLRFVVYGRLSSITKEAIAVDSWCYANKRTRYDCNVRRTTIVRSAIKRIRRLTQTE